jgi:lipopolysaccharide biosynthesis glycosyltransferase
MRQPVRIDVFTLADDRFGLPLAVHGRSLLDHLPADTRVRLTIADGGITDATRARLMDSWADTRLDVRFVVPSFPDSIRLPLWGRMPAITYARILLAGHFEDDVERVAILDADTVLCRPVTEMFSLPMHGKVVLAAQDPAIPYVDGFDGLVSWRELGLPPRTPYFNAGVMLVDLARWREAGIPARALSFIAEKGAELHYFDQDALNVAIGPGHWGMLDPRWQVQPRMVVDSRIPMPHLSAEQRAQLMADPWLYHFSGRVKPWEVDDGSAACRRFFEYLDLTSWAGWRPEPSRVGRLIEFYDRRLRGHLYPLEQRLCALQRRMSQRRS